jgi:GNAT superfamily N-acetyltransferase
MIERSSDEDLGEIIRWLATEAAEGNSTFHPNRNLIAQGHVDGELLVLREHEKVVAFALGEPGIIDILETRPGYRGRGLGRRLAQHCIDRAAAADVAVIECECAPPTSLPFWQAMGFERIPSRYGHNPRVLLRVDKRHRLPSGSPVAVVIRTFDEEALYREAVPSLHEYRPTAVRLESGKIALAERILLHEPTLPNGHDLAVEIEVDGELVVFDKAKRQKMSAIGVRHDRFQYFFLDRINPEATAED